MLTATPQDRGNLTTSIILYQSVKIVKYFIKKVCLATSYPHRGKPPTTFGVQVLNFRVRHGNGCDHLAIVTRRRARALKTEVINNHLLEQGLDRLVSLSSACRHASTRDLSTSSSLRGLS